jgi:hypothetical protein
MRVVCPGCGFSIVEVKSLGHVNAQFHCPNCGKDFGVVFEAEPPASVPDATGDSTATK